MSTEDPCANPTGEQNHKHPSVSLVITTYNDEQYLKAAIASSLDQTRAPDEIIVVDDGSAHDVSPIVMEFAGVRLVRQTNRGLAAARNTGLDECTGDFVAFLDADDLLLPTAFEAGLTCFSAHPDAGFVYGAYRDVDAEGETRSLFEYTPMSGDPFLRFLHANIVGMHATVLYRRDRLKLVGGFNPKRRKCEDYEIYLRLARCFPVASHPTLITLYRRHSGNMSLDSRGMLASALAVLDAQAHHASMRPGGMKALRAGRAFWREYYAKLMVRTALRGSIPAGLRLHLLAAALTASSRAALVSILRIGRSSIAARRSRPAKN